MASATTIAVLAILIALALHWLWHEPTSSLNKLPGPFWARYTNLWRLLSVYKGHSDLTQLHLHRKHGDFVRIGPNCVSISDPSYIKTIYPTRDPLIKSDFYAAGDEFFQGRRIEAQFTTRDEAWHDYLIRPIKGAYSLTAVLNFEGRVDSTIEYFLGKLHGEYAATKDVCLLGDLLRDFAFDVVGEVTFSERLGALDGEKMPREIMRNSESGVNYMGIVGQMPWLDKVLRNRYVALGPHGDSSAADYAANRLKDRLETKSDDSPPHEDFLNLFIEAENNKQEGGEGSDLTQRQISWLILNLVAGSDTTAVTLQSAVYFISRSLQIQQRLVDDLRRASPSHPITWKVCQELPYLCAIVKESLRLCPSVGLPLERIVSSKGLTLSNGVTLPPGSIVGINPRVINHDVRTFGTNADEFMPERWLQGEDESPAEHQERLHRMKEADLTFGAGRRSCIGKNLAVMEMHKCIAQLFWKFEVRGRLEIFLLWRES